MTCSGSACGKQIRLSKGAVWTVSICFHISHAHLGSGLKYSRICHSGAFSEADPRCVLVNASLSQFQAPSDRSAIARQRCRCTKLGHCFPDICRFRSYHLIFVPLAIRINYSHFSAVVFQLHARLNTRISFEEQGAFVTGIFEHRNRLNSMDAWIP